MDQRTDERARRTMHGIAIIADDLTGALDAAAPLRRQGLRAMVALDAPSVEPSAGYDVVALTTESRHAGDPAPLLRAAVAHVPARRLLYKKIDSTLRGPVAAELRALLDERRFTTALVTPALPQQGRGLLDGRLVVAGQPTALHLPSLLAASGLHATVVPLAVVRDPVALHRTLHDAARTATVIVPDAMEDHDLAALARALATLDVLPLLAGSAGLAAWLPVVLGLRPSAQPARSNVVPPLLFAFGSANQRTAAQCRKLRGAGVAAVELAPDDDATTAAAITSCAGSLLRGEDVVLSLVPPRDTIERVSAAMQRRAALRMAEVVAAVRERSGVATLIVGGGDIAYAVCQRLGVRRLELDDELLPGLPLSHGTTSAGQTVRMVTKAGGFGAPDALRQIHTMLHGDSR